MRLAFNPVRRQPTIYRRELVVVGRGFFRDSRTIGGRWGSYAIFRPALIGGDCGNLPPFGSVSPGVNDWTIKTIILGIAFAARGFSGRHGLVGQLPVA